MMDNVFQRRDNLRSQTKFLKSYVNTSQHGLKSLRVSVFSPKVDKVALYRKL